MQLFMGPDTFKLKGHRHRAHFRRKLLLLLSFQEAFLNAQVYLFPGKAFLLSCLWAWMIAA